MKHLITTAGNTGDWFSKDFAIISINDHFLEEVKKAREFIKSAPEDLINKTEITLYPFNISFYDSYELEELEEANYNSDIEIISDWINGEWKNQLIEIQDLDRLDCLCGEVKHTSGGRCEVAIGGVTFVDYPKHSEEEIFTDEIPFEDLGL